MKFKIKNLINCKIDMSRVVRYWDGTTPPKIEIDVIDPDTKRTGYLSNNLTVVSNDGYIFEDVESIGSFSINLSSVEYVIDFKDFKENDIWKHFDAVKNGRVYDLTYENFGMSATFRYPKALEELQPILYPESKADEEKAKKNSKDAQKKAEDSNAEAMYEEEQNKNK